MTKPGPCISGAKTSSFMTHFYTNVLPPRSSLTFLNTRGAQANMLIYRANLYTGLKDTVLLLRAAIKTTGTYGATQGGRESLLYFAHAFTLTFLLPLNLFSLRNGCNQGRHPPRNSTGSCGSKKESAGIMGPCCIWSRKGKREQGRWTNELVLVGLFHQESLLGHIQMCDHEMRKETTSTAIRFWNFTV